MKKWVLFLVLSTVPLISNAQEIRGLYINDFNRILGRATQEDSLCSYIKECRFNHLLIYSLNDLNMGNQKTRTRLRSLFRRFRNECGVIRIGAVGENYDFFKKEIHPYNLDAKTQPEERFDIYDLEFEFWSETSIERYYCADYLQAAGFPCTEEGAFSYVRQTLLDLRTLKQDLPGLETEIYIGWIKPEHAAQLPALVDRILPAVYLAAATDGTINLYNPAEQRQRLRDIAAGGPVKVVPIFNGDRTSSDPDLYPWLISGHTVCQPWMNYYAGFSAETDASIKKNIQLEGYQWFKYSGMPPVPFILNTPGPVDGPEFPEVMYPHHYSIPVPKDADQIRWMLASVGISSINVAGENSIEVMFRNPGRDTLFVQTFLCGAKSRIAIFPLLVKDIGLDVISEEARGWTQETRAWSRGDDIVIRMDQSLPRQGLLTLTDAVGRRILTRVIPAGFSGELHIPAGNGLYLIAVTSGKERFTAKVMR